MGGEKHGGACSIVWRCTVTVQSMWRDGIIMWSAVFWCLGDWHNSNETQIARNRTNGNTEKNKNLMEQLINIAPNHTFNLIYWIDANYTEHTRFHLILSERKTILFFGCLYVFITKSAPMIQKQIISVCRSFRRQPSLFGVGQRMRKMKYSTNTTKHRTKN